MTKYYQKKNGRNHKLSRFNCGFDTAAWFLLSSVYGCHFCDVRHIKHTHIHNSINLIAIYFRWIGIYFFFNYCVRAIKCCGIIHSCSDAMFIVNKFNSCSAAAVAVVVVAAVVVGVVLIVPALAVFFSLSVSVLCIHGHEFVIAWCMRACVFVQASEWTSAQAHVWWKTCNKIWYHDKKRHCTK